MDGGSRLVEDEGRHADRGNRREDRHQNSGGRYDNGGSQRVENRSRYTESERDVRHGEKSRHNESGASLANDRDRSRRDDKDGRSSRKARRSSETLKPRDLASPKPSDTEHRSTGSKKKRLERISDDEEVDAKEKAKERKRKRQEEVLPHQSSTEMDVLDSVSPKKDSHKVNASFSSKVKDKASKATAEKGKDVMAETEQDLLGDYEFNPFVDVELDYDENMDDGNHMDESRGEVQINDEKEVEDVEVEQEIEEEEEEEDVQVAVEVEVEEEEEGEMSGSERVSRDPSHEDISSVSSQDGDSKEKTVAISSPIRVTPERDMDRKKGSSSKWRKDKKRSSSGGSKKLSVKDRLFVSRKAIEEKKNALGRNNVETLRPSLANRLGPSPGNRRRLSSGAGSKRVSKTSLIDRPSKGSALEIAEAYKKKKKIEERKMAAHGDRRPKKLPKLSKVSPLPGTNADKEKALDKRIDRIKQKNRDREKRIKEIEKEKRLFS